MKEEGSLRSLIKQVRKDGSLLCMKSCKPSVCHGNNCESYPSGTEIMDFIYLFIYLFLPSDGMILWGLALVTALQVCRLSLLFSWSSLLSPQQCVQTGDAKKNK